MKKKLPLLHTKQEIEQEFLKTLSEDEGNDLLNLYRAYWKYVYKYAVGDEEGFEKDDKKYHGCFGPDLREFHEQTYNDGMSIKVGKGY